MSRARTTHNALGANGAIANHAAQTDADRASCHRRNGCPGAHRRAAALATDARAHGFVNATAKPPCAAFAACACRVGVRVEQVLSRALPHVRVGHRLRTRATASRTQTCAPTSTKVAATPCLVVNMIVLWPRLAESTKLRCDDAARGPARAQTASRMAVWCTSHELNQPHPRRHGRPRRPVRQRGGWRTRAAVLPRRLRCLRGNGWNSRERAAPRG